MPYIRLDIIRIKLAIVRRECQILPADRIDCQGPHQTTVVQRNGRVREPGNLSGAGKLVERSGHLAVENQHLENRIVSGRMPGAADGEIGGQRGPLIGGGAIEIDACAPADPHQTSQFGEVFEGIAAVVVIAGEREIREWRLIPGLRGNVVPVHDLLGERPVIKGSCCRIDGAMVVAVHDSRCPGRLCPLLPGVGRLRIAHKFGRRAYARIVIATEEEDLTRNRIPDGVVGITDDLAGSPSAHVRTGERGIEIVGLKLGPCPGLHRRRTTSQSGRLSRSRVKIKKDKS